jgi:hypothetical protein
MRPVTAEFLAALRGSHDMCARARIVAPGQTGVDPDGTEIPILGGDVVLDANAEIRGSVDIETSSDQWPTTATDLATPYGNELFVERGIKMGGGTRIWVSQGYYRIDTVDQDSIPGSMVIAGSDRMSQVVDARLVAPVQFGAAVTLESVVEQLVLEVLPDATFAIDVDFATATVGRAAVAEEDRFKFLAKLVRAHGKIWYWDHTGALRITSPPDATNPVFTVNSGSGGVLVKLARKLTRDGMYNAVLATGEGPDSDNPVRALAYDADPMSPTYWHGQFGKIPRMFSSPFITTTAQAKSAASSMLRRVLGLPSQVQFSAVPNPALEPEDPVRVVSPATGSRIHILERLSLPLTNDGGPIAATTREQVEPDIQFEE